MRAILLVIVLASTASAEPLYQEKTTDKPDIKCPTAAPCVVEYDFAYWVLVNGSPRYFVADYGSSDAPLRKGTKDRAEQNARAVKALTEILTTKLKTRAAKLECGVVARVPELMGFGDTLDVPVGGSTVKPLVKTTIKDVIATWEKLVDKHAERWGSQPPGRDVFGATELAKMTATTFAKPTVVRRGAWISGKTCQGDKCTDEITTELMLYILYSRESATAYVFDATLSMPEKEYKTKSKQMQTTARAAIAATAASLGHKTVALDTATMCRTGMLPADWFDWKAKP